MRCKGYLNGQITIFLSMLITVFLSLTAALLYSSICSGKKVMAENAADISVNSLFAEYNKKLLEEYDLLYLDMEELGKGISKSGIAAECKDMMDKHISYDTKLSGISGVLGYTNLLKIDSPQIECSRYSIASDLNGEVYRQQAVDYMKATYPALITELMTEIYKSYKTGSLKEKTKISRQIVHLSNSKTEKAEPDLKGVSPDILGYMNLIKSNGILKYVWYKPLSCNAIDKSSCISKRQDINKGNGIFNNLKYDGVYDKILFNEYLIKHFGNALEPMKDRGLNYEIEYILSGKDSDSKNLSAAANKLLLIRETSNCLHIMSDGAKMAEASALGTAIATLLLSPEAADIMTKAVVAVWGFGESMLDLKDLFAGKKVPVLKTSEEFKLELTNITNIFSQKYKDSNSVFALDYKGYLRLLLLANSKDKTTVRSMDLIEVNMRKDDKYKNFRMDACVEWAELNMNFNINKDFIFNKKYGYIQ